MQGPQVSLAVLAPQDLRVNSSSDSPARMHAHPWYALEWAFTSALATIPLSLLYNSDALAESTFVHLLDMGVTPGMLAVATALVVSLRAVSLWFNGALQPWSAIGRILGALLTGLLWLELSVALALYHFSTGRPASVGILLWLSFAAWEVVNCYRAANDVFARI